MERNEETKPKKEKKTDQSTIDNVEDSEDFERSEDLGAFPDLKEAIGSFLADSVQEIVSSVVTVFEEKLLQPAREKVFGGVKQSLKEFVKKSLRDNNNVLKKVHTTPESQIKEIIDKFMAKHETKEIMESIFSALENIGGSAANILLEISGILNKSDEFLKYVIELVSYLEENLKEDGCNNNVEEIIENISSRIAEKMFSQCGEVVLDTIAEHLKSFFSGEEEADPYKVLGLEPSASLDEVSEAFKRLTLQLSSDENKNDSNKKEKMQQIVDAYEAIKKKQKS